MRLQGHHAIVTGGGTGIGAAIARALAGEGAKLTLVGRRRELLEEVGSSLPDALIAPADVTDRDQVENAFADARRAQGSITILVNNAGAAAAMPFAKVTTEAWRATIAVNLDALLHCCQAALPDLLAAPSARIVTVSSIAGLKGGAYIAPYVAAKHGAVGLTRALAAEFATTNLTVNAVCPGYVETDIVSNAIANIREKTGRSDEEARATLTATNPQGRLIQPEEVASTVLWLCLPESGSVNGQAIAINGGEA
jgi:NAD(P)-dependent dehydrogenase (short-subunit alcohol dehydrogenase family)